ncbi:hypothetical protein LWE61_10240 [Sphingobium sufflavum]|uniref:hypothetical protein n=1 Tax=Sphingobium sufflavum TaxID=1129547 RepID=UPI001F4770DA|nr:hypothetical protein [Sphingobium sufflavum]MCE7796936.1 hypothetical protein [Sphingobium sufflavum]
MKKPSTAIDLGIRAIGALLTTGACLLGRAQNEIKSRTLPDPSGLLEWLATIGCVMGLCFGALLLLTGARLFTRSR